MDPNNLRADILLEIHQHEATKTSELCSDQKIAAATGAAKVDVQYQLDIFESEGLVELSKTFGGTPGLNYEARLTPKGMVAIEGLTDAPPRPVGF